MLTLHRLLVEISFVRQYITISIPPVECRIHDSKLVMTQVGVYGLLLVLIVCANLRARILTFHRLLVEISFVRQYINSARWMSNTWFQFCYDASQSLLDPCSFKSCKLILSLKCSVCKTKLEWRLVSVARKFEEKFDSGTVIIGY